MTQPEPGDESGTPRALLDATDVRALDAQYRPFESFGSWSVLKVDEAIWNRNVQALDQQATQLTAEDLDHAASVAMRAAALETGAIEGLYETDRGMTYTIAVRGALWQQALRSRGEKVADLFQAQLDAYELASEIASSSRPITEVWLRELHEVLTKPQASYDALTPQGWIQKKLNKGEYKIDPNHVKQADGTSHAYAPVDMTSSEMHRLVEELNSPRFANAHPVLQAAYSHYSLVAIHPFADGNGRVARALASVYLRRNSRIPLLIWADQKAQYLDALEGADRGKKEGFTDFVLDRANDALVLVLTELGPQPQQFLEKLTKLHVSHGGLTVRELDDLAREIVNRVLGELQLIVGQLKFPPGVSTAFSSGGSPYSIEDDEYRIPQNPSAAHVAVSSSWPAEANTTLQYQVRIARNESARYALRIYCRGVDDLTVESFDVRVEDVHPALSESWLFRVRKWLELTLGVALSRLTKDAEQAHRELGL